MQTFSCDFGNGLSCTVRVPDTAPPRGTRHIQQTEWSRRPKSLDFLRPYIAWMNSVNQSLADQWGTKLMHVYETGRNWSVLEMWVFEPGKRPQLIDLKGKPQTKT